ASTSRSPSCCSASCMSHTAFSSRRLLRVAGIWSNIRLGRYFRSRCKRKLTSHHHGLVGCDAALDYSEVAFLTLAGLHRSKFDSIVGFHHENKRPILANLNGLRRDKRGVLEHVQDETHAHKFRRPQ